MNQDINDYYDEMSIWMEKNWKWLSVVQLLAFEGYLIRLVLAGSKCREPFTTRVSVYWYFS
jgi:hypothetical protein